jgi:hypothetical protein
MMHIRSGIDMYQEAYACDNEQKERRKCIDLKRKRDEQLAGLNERKQGYDMSLISGGLYFEEDQEGNDERSENGKASQKAAQAFRHGLPKNPVDEEPYQRKKRNEVNII